MTNDCLDGLDDVALEKVERIECGAPDAVACFDFENAKKLVANIEALISYADRVKARCAPVPRGTAER